jgi:hypothetical protein
MVALMECPRRDCKITILAKDIDGPFELSPEFNCLLHGESGS